MRAFHDRKAPRQPSRSYTVMVITHYRLPGSSRDRLNFGLQLIPYSEVPNGIKFSEKTNFQRLNDATLQPDTFGVNALYPRRETARVLRRR